MLRIVESADSHNEHENLVSIVARVQLLVMVMMESTDLLLKRLTSRTEHRMCDRC